MKKIQIKLILMLVYFGNIQTLRSQSLDTLSCTPQQIYSTATIYFETNQTDTVSLSLYNSIGVEKISFFQDSAINVGSHSLTLFGDSLEQGIYILVLRNRYDTLAIHIVKLSGTAALAKKAISNSLLIFPNPTNDVININYTIASNSQTHIQINNSLGQTVKEVSKLEKAGTYKLTIDTKSLENGIYFINFSDGSTQQKIKFLVH